MVFRLEIQFVPSVLTPARASDCRCSFQVSEMKSVSLERDVVGFAVNCLWAIGYNFALTDELFANVEAKSGKGTMAFHHALSAIWFGL